MRILHTSDWHLGKDLFSFSLIEDQRDYLKNFAALAAEEKVDAIVIAGDLYHRAVPSGEAVSLLNETFTHLVADLKIPVLAIAGNHDSPERLAFGANLYESSGLYLESIPSKIIRRIRLQDDYGEVEFFLLPYIEPYEIRKLLNNPDIKTFQDAYANLFSLPENQPSKNIRNVLIAHGLFGKTGEGVSFSDSERNIGGAELVDTSLFDAFDYVALGHLHAPQRAGKESIRYSGSILKYSLSEATQRKGVLLVELDSKGFLSVEEKTISPTRNLRILEGSLSELTEQSQDDLCTEDYIYAKLSDPELYDAMGKLRSIYPNSIGLSLDSRREVSEYEPLQLEKARHLSAQEHFDTFFETMTGRKMEEEEIGVMKEVFHKAEQEERA